MSPFSTPVLAGAALLTSPAWWRAVEGTGSLSVATTRFLVAALVCWLALEVVAAMVGPAPVRVPVDAEAGRGPESVSATAPSSGPSSGSLPETGDGPAVS